MGNWLISSVFLCCLFFSGDSNIIHWQNEQQLDWSDFEGRASRSEAADVVALTASGIGYSYVCENGLLEIDFEAIFQKDKSWVKPAGKNDYCLKHEQLHFDITELFARKARKAFVGKYNCNKTRELEHDVNQLLEDWQAYQVKYDKETDHSNIASKQQDWNVLVNKELEALKYFRRE